MDGIHGRIIAIWIFKNSHNTFDTFFFFFTWWKLCFNQKKWHKHARRSERRVHFAAVTWPLWAWKDQVLKQSSRNWGSRWKEFDEFSCQASYGALHHIRMVVSPPQPCFIMKRCCLPTELSGLIIILTLPTESWKGIIPPQRLLAIHSS